jgi:hypothetical protein
MTPLFVIAIIASVASVAKITAFCAARFDDLTSNNNLENHCYVR